MSWRENPGHVPPEAKGKRVKVRLRNGSVLGEEPLANACPAGWPADASTNGAKAPYPRWSFSTDPHERQFDIVLWDFVGG